MGFLTELRRGFGPMPVPLETQWIARQTRVMESRVQMRTIEDMDMGSSTVSDLLLRAQGLTSRPWRAASIREAMGVPAIFGAVNLIANIVGSLSMKALRNEVELPPDQRPRIVVRPDPFTIPREFYRGSGYNLASRGETWWWTAARDFDGQPLSVINVNPAEVTVEEDTNDLRYPIVKWRGRVMKREDFRQLVYAREPGSLRGHGPLQMCGAAISVAVEAQEWAANYYAGGGRPPLIIKTAGELGANPDYPDATTEAQALRLQWMDQDPNTPRVIDQGIEDIDYPPENSSSAAMLTSRGYQNVEVATMFGMDASMLNAAIEGSSVTYQNVGTEFEKFLRKCLRPNYLEVIEQTMSDLLPRSTVARFNTDALTLADPKTRYEVYGIGITAGIIDSEEARKAEGYAPGDVENAAVPYSPPQAIPSQLPIQEMRVAADVRCDGKRMLRGVLSPCNKLLSQSGAFVGTCGRCGKAHDIAAQVRTAPVIQIASHRPKAAVASPAATSSVAEPDPPSDIAVLRSLMETMPERIAAALPHSPTVQIAEGAFRSDLHLPPTPRVQKRIERDGTGYIITEE